MFKYVFSLATLFIFFSAQASQLVVISDLDETLRQANVEHKLKAGLKLLSGVKPYAGAQILFNEIAAKNPGAKFYYLSNSFSFVYNGKKWVKKNGFPVGTVFQRKLGDKSDSFKPKKLQEIAAENPGANMLMFGDNVERDPKFYSDLVATFGIPARIFIRDARLLFPQDSTMTYYQHEAQILADLNASESTTTAVRSLHFNHLVPAFLMKNLRERLMDECKQPKDVCEMEADEHMSDVRSKLEVTEEVIEREVLAAQ